MTTTTPETRTQDTEIVEAITAAIAEVLGSVPADIAEDTRLAEDLGLDSTSVLSLLMALEDTLDMQVDPDSLEQRHLETIGSLAGYIAESR
ncbi:acyl carrier protein [Actinocrinis sp.]|uniref:acyl carrier protein n=1 Tax=Actinocrinis sp. TaxID=1920516 RepID=UPI002D2490CC|nr:phosphopantetheine-binding protein [Actinocrinis sp.]HZP50438.1 phosphopantetheine-binding protein [Actinocrinis sp.]